jgi:exodeoxyribonuclease VII large subunit
VTAVGHEQDTPLCDLAADRRASTPTAAGRLVVPDLEELLAGLARSRDGLSRGTRRLLERRRQWLDQRHERLRRAPALAIERHRARLAQAGGRLRTLSPKATLERGYAIVRREGELVRSSGAVVPGDPIAVEVADGSFGARVE